MGWIKKGDSTNHGEKKIGKAKKKKNFQKGGQGVISFGRGMDR